MLKAVVSRGAPLRSATRRSGMFVGAGALVAPTYLAGTQLRAQCTERASACDASSAAAAAAAAAAASRTPEGPEPLVQVDIGGAYPVIGTVEHAGCGALFLRVATPAKVDATSETVMSRVPSVGAPPPTFVYVALPESLVARSSTTILSVPAASDRGAAHALSHPTATMAKNRRSDEDAETITSEAVLQSFRDRGARTYDPDSDAWADLMSPCGREGRRVAKDEDGLDCCDRVKACVDYTADKWAARLKPFQTSDERRAAYMEEERNARVSIAQQEAHDAATHHEGKNTLTFPDIVRYPEPNHTGAKETRDDEVMKQYRYKSVLATLVYRRSYFSERFIVGLKNYSIASAQGYGVFCNDQTPPVSEIGYVRWFVYSTVNIASRFVTSVLAAGLRRYEAWFGELSTVYVNMHRAPVVAPIGCYVHDSDIITYAGSAMIFKGAYTWSPNVEFLNEADAGLVPHDLRNVQNVEKNPTIFSVTVCVPKFPIWRRRCRYLLYVGLFGLDIAIPLLIVDMLVARISGAVIFAAARKGHANERGYWHLFLFVGMSFFTCVLLVLAFMAAERYQTTAAVPIVKSHVEAVTILRRMCELASHSTAVNEAYSECLQTWWKCGGVPSPDTVKAFEPNVDRLRTGVRVWLGLCDLAGVDAMKSTIVPEADDYTAQKALRHLLNQFEKLYVLEGAKKLYTDIAALDDRSIATTALSYLCAVALHDIGHSASFYHLSVQCTDYHRRCRALLNRDLGPERHAHIIQSLDQIDQRIRDRTGYLTSMIAVVDAATDYGAATGHAADVQREDGLTRKHARFRVEEAKSALLRAVRPFLTMYGDNTRDSGASFISRNEDIELCGTITAQGVPRMVVLRGPREEESGYAPIMLLCVGRAPASAASDTSSAAAGVMRWAFAAMAARLFGTSTRRSDIMTVKEAQEQVKRESDRDASFVLPPDVGMERSTCQTFLELEPQLYKLGMELRQTSPYNTIHVVGREHNGAIAQVVAAYLHRRTCSHFNFCSNGGYHFDPVVLHTIDSHAVFNSRAISEMRALPGISHQRVVIQPSFQSRVVNAILDRGKAHDLRHFGIETKINQKPVGSMWLHTVLRSLLTPHPLEQLRRQQRLDEKPVASLVNYVDEHLDILPEVAFTSGVWGSDNVAPENLSGLRVEQPNPSLASALLGSVTLKA